MRSRRPSGASPDRGGDAPSRSSGQSSGSGPGRFAPGRALGDPGITCERCARRFGGSFGYSRHLDRRADRCRTDAALRARHLVLRADGVWIQYRSRQGRLFPLSTGRTRVPENIVHGLQERRRARSRASALPGQIELLTELVVAA